MSKKKVKLYIYDALDFYAGWIFELVRESCGRYEVVVHGYKSNMVLDTRAFKKGDKVTLSSEDWENVSFYKNKII